MLDVLIQTHNEELNLPFALASVSGWASNVFVVDSGSTDRTVEIAAAAGARVVHHAWEGYAGQKNWALNNLPWQSPWILILDADEAVTPELRDEILGVTNGPVEATVEAGFYLNRVFIFMGRQIHHCGYFPSWNLRLFKVGRARYEERRVHEHMLVDGKTAELRQLLLHEDRRGLEHFIAKHNRYSTLESQELYAAQTPWPGMAQFLGDHRVRRRFLKTRVLPRLPAPWLWKFVYMYVFQEGFLDRAPGWNLCLFISTYEYFIQIKYKELRRLRGRRPVGAGLSVAEGSVREIDLPRRVSTNGSAAGVSMPVVVPRFASADAQAAAVVPHDGVPVSRPAGVPVSVLIPALNEAKNLPRCLDHLAWADEVVIVDSGSKDATQAIADAYGARVVQFRWDGQWPKKKNWALRNVDFKHEWVLIVDADEWITPALADEIAAAVTRQGDHAGFYVNRRFIFMGGWIKHCGYYPSWNLRLIRRGRGEYERLTDVGDTGSGDNEVHEHIVADGQVGHFDADMLHFAFPNINTFVEKHNRYSNWEAAVQYKNLHAEAAEIGSTLSGRRRLKNFSRRLPFRPTLRFLYSYVLRGGFLDGQPGYVFCRLLAMYEFLSVAKFIELKRAQHDESQLKKLSAVGPSLLVETAPRQLTTSGSAS